MNKLASRSRASKILTAAIDKTDKVQVELQHAADDLGTTNAVLAGPMAAAQAVAAIANAVEQNVAAETKVQDAADELESVKDLIKEAQVQQGADAGPPRVGEGTASILAYFEGRRAQAREDEAQRDNGAQAAQK